MSRTAQWSINLYADCPHCNEYVDLLDICDFWDGASFNICEYDTDKTRNVEVLCPECGKNFTVDFVY